MRCVPEDILCDIHKDGAVRLPLSSVALSNVPRDIMLHEEMYNLMLHNAEEYCNNGPTHLSVDIPRSNLAPRHNDIRVQEFCIEGDFVAFAMPGFAKRPLVQCCPYGKISPKAVKGDVSNDLDTLFDLVCRNGGRVFVSTKDVTTNNRLCLCKVSVTLPVGWFAQEKSIHAIIIGLGYRTVKSLSLRWRCNWNWTVAFVRFDFDGLWFVVAAESPGRIFHNGTTRLSLFSFLFASCTIIFDSRTLHHVFVLFCFVWCVRVRMYMSKYLYGILVGVGVNVVWV